MKLLRTRWEILLLLQIFATVNAGVVFQLFDKPTAGYVAGSVFVLVGFFSVYRFRSPVSLWAKAGFAVAILHTLGACILFGKRMTLPMHESVQEVIGIPMAYYHKGSTYIFLVLMMLTLAMVLRARKHPDRHH